MILHFTLAYQHIIHICIGIFVYHLSVYWSLEWKPFRILYELGICTIIYTTQHADPYLN